MPPRPRAQQNDFNPDALVKVDQYAKDSEEIKSRISGLEDKFGSNEKFANSFADAAIGQTKIQDTVTALIVKQVKENAEVQEEITKHINKSDRNAVSVFLKRFGFGIWTLIVALFGGAVVFFLQK